MTIVILMVMLILVTRLFSGMAEARKPGRGSVPSTSSPPPNAQNRSRTPDAPLNVPGAPAPYGYMRAARGLPTDVPLSAASRRAIESDITHFGIELRELDFDVDGYELTETTRGDHTRALNAYENARLALRGARSDSEATHITRVLEDGRHFVGRVRARALGKPIPPRRPPCFFDPAHGPSSQDVDWAPQGGASLPVPACAVDAARLGLGAEPRVRLVEGDRGPVPYWEDSRHGAWARGYYGPWMNDPSMRRMTHGTLMIDGFSVLMGMRDD